MQKTYDPKEIESKWGPLWEKAGYFKPSQHGKPYCIVLPPPNVTGTLHMGHGFQQTLMDVLIRYHRMRGFNTLWQPGTDHAGIATQMVVEQRLPPRFRPRSLFKGRMGVERVFRLPYYRTNSPPRRLHRLVSRAFYV